MVWFVDPCGNACAERACRVGCSTRSPPQPRRRTNVAELTAGYELVVDDECHHVPAAAFEQAVKQIRARHWLGLTATLWVPKTASAQVRPLLFLMRRRLVVAPIRRTTPVTNRGHTDQLCSCDCPTSP